MDYTPKKYSILWSIIQKLPRKNGIYSKNLDTDENIIIHINLRRLNNGTDN